MMFIEEKKLRDAFWKKYGYRSNIIAYQFECQARHGGVDLLTVELVPNKETNTQSIQFVSFEFKLDDIKKALAQAEENTKFCHKSFIVVPAAKLSTIQDRYLDYLKKTKYVGVIGVELGGRWTIPAWWRCWTKRDEEVCLNQECMKLLTTCKNGLLLR